MFAWHFNYFDHNFNDNKINIVALLATLSIQKKPQETIGKARDADCARQTSSLSNAARCR
jgi:hypothetical protein